jgi:hypothetical protein
MQKKTGKCALCGHHNAFHHAFKDEKLCSICQESYPEGRCVPYEASNAYRRGAK